ncbi:MAG: hypothetical protein COB36_08675 [Alphaproteobacteria bacterium]|nr:MAG: hypothetical protein COB36_08675 [Alphaproteobacteria bacterium]
MSNDMEKQGLSKVAGVHARDIMVGHSLVPDSTEEHMFSTGKLKQAFLNADPFSGENRQTFTQSVLQGDTPNRTVLQSISPKTSYKTDSNNTQALNRNAQSSVSDGGKMQGNAATMKADIKSTMARAKSDMKQAQAEQADATKHAAIDQDISVSSAQDAMSPQAGADKIAAAAAITADLMVGGGTFATMGKAVFVQHGVSEQDKKLSPKQLQALAEDSQARAASSGNNEAAIDSNAGATVRLDVGAKSNFDFEGMSVDEYIDLAQTDIEDTPEMMALMDDLSAVDKVQSNLGRLEDRSDVAFDLSDEKVDAISVELTGQGLQGISSFKVDTLAANDVTFSAVEDVAPKLNADEDMAEYKPPVMALAQMQMA